MRQFKLKWSSVLQKILEEFDAFKNSNRNSTNNKTVGEITYHLTKITLHKNQRFTAIFTRALWIFKLPPPSHLGISKLKKKKKKKRRREAFIASKKSEAAAGV